MRRKRLRQRSERGTSSPALVALGQAGPELLLQGTEEAEKAEQRCAAPRAGESKKAPFERDSVTNTNTKTWFYTGATPKQRVCTWMLPQLPRAQTARALEERKAERWERKQRHSNSSRTIGANDAWPNYHRYHATTQNAMITAATQNCFCETGTRLVELNFL